MAKRFGTTLDAEMGNAQSQEHLPAHPPDVGRNAFGCGFVHNGIVRN